MKLSIKDIQNRYNCSKKVAEKSYQGFLNFLNWLDNTKLEIVESESELVSEKYKFGGCNDWVLSDRGKLAIGDIKTSDKVFQDHMIQVAAYGQLWNENNPTEQIDGGYHLLRFSKEHADFSHHYWSDLSDAFRQFELFREAYDIDKKLKKRTG